MLLSPLYFDRSQESQEKVVFVLQNTTLNTTFTVRIFAACKSTAKEILRMLQGLAVCLAKMEDEKEQTLK